MIDARWRIRRPDGGEVLTIGNARPIERPDGTRAGAVLTLRDDTARKAAETERSRMAAIVEQSRDFIGIADPEGRMIFLNEASRALLGLEHLDATLGTGVDYFLSEDQAIRRSGFCQKMAGGAVAVRLDAKLAHAVQRTKPLQPERPLV